MMRSYDLRVAALDSLVARVAACSSIKSASRELRLPDQVPAGSTPCAFVSCVEIGYARDHARDPGVQTISAEIYVYVFGQAASSLPYRLLAVVAEIEAALRGQPEETLTFATTLGGTVLGAEVTRIELDEGQLDNTKSIAVISVEITTKGE
jgi:hypothetical protein